MTKHLPETSEVVRRVKLRYPGAVLTSEIQAYAFLRQFEEGYTSYTMLTSPTQDDDRWAGVCAFNLLKDMRAVELYYRSISRGNAAARINLAHSLSYIERGDEVADELALVPYDQLSHYDKVLFLRVKSLYEESSSHLLRALDDITEAWRLAETQPEAEPMAVEVLSQLAIVESRVGLGKRALRHIEDGTLLHNTHANSVLPVVECSVLLTLGRFHSAISRLETILTSHGVPAQNRCSAQVLLADANWALGHITEAREAFYTAIARASSLDLGYEEFLSHLGLAMLHIPSEDFLTAFDHLAKAEILISDRSDRALYRFREVLLRFASGTYGPMTALLELEGLIDELHDMGALQEEGRVRLHAARLMWLMEDPTYTEQLDALQDLVDRLQNAGFLAREFVLMNDFRQVVLSTHPGLDNVADETLEVTTLGEPGIALNGQPLALSMRHAPQLLAFLLDRRSATLADILEQALPHEKHASARSYFHQFRHRLNSLVPQVSIEYDRSSRTYSVNSDLQLRWDVQQVLTGHQHEPGEFLPELATPWAAGVRERLAKEVDTEVTAAGNDPP